jgi:hypothetical protein
MSKNKSQFINHKYYPGSAKITNIESNLDKKARKGEIIPECYICGVYDDLIKRSGFYICPDCRTYENLFDSDME